MKKPNSMRYTSDPKYMQQLLRDLEECGWGRRSVCKELGIAYRSMTDYVTGKTQWSYATQYAVESLRDWVRELCSTTRSREAFDRRAESA